VTVELAAFNSAYPVVIELPVQWGDMDAFLHVNNIVYLRWFESARIAYLDRIGAMSLVDLSGLGPILASSSIRYRLPIEYPDTVSVGIKAKKYNGSELIHDYAVFSHQKNALATVGEARLVMFSFKLQQKVAISTSLLKNISDLESLSS